jgi:hypothetical protein
MYLEDIGPGSGGAAIIVAALTVAPVIINGVSIYGQNIPAVVDNVYYQAAQQLNNQAGQYADKGGDAGGADPNDPFKRLSEHERNLGIDRATGQFRQAEVDAALRLEQRIGQQLERYDPKIHPADKYGDWIAKQGNTYTSYDAVGPLPDPSYLRYDSFVAQINTHLLKQGVDFVVVDLTGIGSTQAAAIQNHINSLASEQLSRIIVQGIP